MRIPSRLLPALLIFPAVLCAQDDDKLVRGKRASEWMVVLRTDKEVVARQRALLALEMAGPQTKKIFEEIGSALRLDAEEAVRFQAAGTLGRLAAKAVDPDRKEKLPIKAAVDALGSSLTVEREKSARVRAGVASALGRIGPFAVNALPVLGEALKDQDADVRSASAEAIAAVGSTAKEILKEIVAALKTTSGKDNIRMRAGLVLAIQRIGRPDAVEAVPALIPFLKESPPAGLTLVELKRFHETRRQIVETLGVLGDLAAFDPILELFRKAMTDKDSDMARAALTALIGLSGDKKPLVRVLVETMQDDPKKLQDHLVRCQAIATLGMLGKDLGEHRGAVIDGLRSGLKDKLGEVRLASILAVGELGKDVLGKEAEVLASELRVLKRSSEKSIAEAAEAVLKKIG